MKKFRKWKPCRRDSCTAPTEHSSCCVTVCLAAVLDLFLISQSRIIARLRLQCVATNQEERFICLRVGSLILAKINYLEGRIYNYII